MSGYDFRESEKKRQHFWQEKQIYAFDMKDTDKKVFSIDTPPPSVSGQLHIGHVFSYTHAEAIARYKRMTGYNVFYPMGFDDNGLPTENLVEKETKKRPQDMTRKEYIELCQEVIGQYRPKYRSLRESLGFSVDRTRTYSTISERVQKFAQQRFVELVEKGMISKKKFPALRCTKNQTTIAQAEIEEEEIDSFFNDIRFTLEDGQELIIATTRPELMPACVAVFVHPDDERFAKYVGKKVVTPFGHHVPLLTDDKVKMDKGTGAVMCCSYGDETDVYWIMKHDLPTRIIIDRYGKMTETGVEGLDGLKVKDAREKIMTLLDERGVVVKRTAIRQSISMSDRGKVPVEIIPVDQWFVNILTMKHKLLELGDEMHFMPDHMKKRYHDRVENLQRDRNISRNRKFGIPVPVRYSKKTGDIILPDISQLPIDPLVDMPSVLPDGHTADDIQPETMVLDTWFTSGLTPQINQEFLRQDGCSIDILPMSLRPQAQEIIRTWTFYTTIQSWLAPGEVPFHDIMISGHVLAGKGEKISKSKGNAKFTPEEFVTQFGADAVRFWALSGQLGKDMVFEEQEVRNGQKLVMKLRNATSFVNMHLEQVSVEQIRGFDTSTLYSTDQWILQQLNDTILRARMYLEKYEFGLAKIHIEEFFWKDFCDMYLEMVKLRLYKPEMFTDGQQKKQSAQYTLYQVLYAVIQLYAIYVPHVTEEIYQHFFLAYEGYVSLHSVPLVESVFQQLQQHKQYIQQQFLHIASIIQEVRKYKTQQQISMGADVVCLTIQGSQELLDAVQTFHDDVIGVTKAQTIQTILSTEQHIGISDA